MNKKNCHYSCTLNEVCHEITVGFVGSMTQEYISEGIPLLRSLNIKPYKLDLTNIKYISKEFHQKIRKSALKKGDVVVVRTGQPGTSCVIPDEFDGLNCSDLVVARPNPEKIDSYYLAFYLNSMAKQYIGNQLVGAIQQHFNIRSAKEMIIHLPSLNEQLKISKVLNDLNTKIEVNNKINAELEAIAKLIYDYWFVQFDFPFDFAQGKPASNGKPYKSSGGKTVYNKELRREIPEGWEVNSLGDILKTELGGTPSTKNRKFWNGEIPWLNSGEIANFPIIASEENITEEAISSSATSLMPAGTCVLSITRHLRPSILGIAACANQSVVGILESEKLKSSFIYPYLVNEIPRLMTLRTGAQQPHINKKTVDDSLIVNPSLEVLKQYYKQANPIYKQIINNSFQNQKLSDLRDWLLPMLMNGQVTVGEVGEQLGMVAEEAIKYTE